MKNIGYSYNGFTAARLKRFLNTGGQEFEFIEWGKNDYNEPAGQINSKRILGVLHTSSAMINSSEQSSVGSKSRIHSLFSIITSWENLVDGFSAGKDLSPGMSVNLDGTEYKIVKTSNVNNWGIVANISLEEYDEWKH